MTVGVVAMAYGSPRSLDEVEAYYTDVRRGRRPPPELLDDLVRRYRSIGGVSPLRARTEAQAAAIGEALRATAAGSWSVALGYKHATPSVEEAVERLVAEGVDQLVGLVLAPHYSAASVGEYLGRARRRADAGGVPFRGVRSWALEPAYVDFLAAAVERARRDLPARSKVLFTAHSLPRRVVEGGDPYAEEVRSTAVAVADAVGLDRWSGWSVAFQSAGRTPEPWLGPDLLQTLRDLADTGRADGVLVCPCGFVSEHLEVLHDLDREARAVAEAAGLAFARTAVPDDDPSVMAALARRVAALAAQPGDGDG